MTSTTTYADGWTEESSAPPILPIVSQRRMAKARRLVAALDRSAPITAEQAAYLSRYGWDSLARLAGERPCSDLTITTVLGILAGREAIGG